MNELQESVILYVAGEGGAVTLLGRRKADGSGWEFARKAVDSSMLMLDEEQGGVNPEYVPPPPCGPDPGGRRWNCWTGIGGRC
jgi:hypothetical protein